MTPEIEMPNVAAATKAPPPAMAPVGQKPKQKSQQTSFLSPDALPQAQSGGKTFLGA